MRRFCILDFGLALGVLLIVGLSGCGALGVAAYKFSPPPTIEAQYVLPRVPTLVIVENYHDTAGTMADAETLSRYAYEDLHAARVKNTQGHGTVEVAPLVDWKKIYELRSEDPGQFQKMKITDIGKALGAEQVIYVDLLYSEVQEMVGSDMMRGRAAALVRVVECKTGETKWPEGNSGGQAVAYETELKRPGDKMSYAQIREETLEKMGTRVGRLFHAWQMEE